MNALNDSPCPIAIVQSDTTVFNPPLLGLDIFAPGDVSIKNERDTTITKTFPAIASEGVGYPFRWWVRVRQVLDTNTTVADASLVGLVG